MTTIETIESIETAIGRPVDGFLDASDLTAVAERLGVLPEQPEIGSDEYMKQRGFKRVIATIEGGDIVEYPDGHVEFTADADIDADGEGGNPYGDPYFQPETSLKHTDGTSLNSNTERYIVVPPAIVHGVKGIVLGCMAAVLYKGQTATAVVGDIGPTRKTGEISIALARALGIPESPINGGVDERTVRYSLYPDQPALANGQKYHLQKWQGA